MTPQNRLPVPNHATEQLAPEPDPTALLNRRRHKSSPSDETRGGDMSGEATELLGSLAPFAQLPHHEIEALAESCSFATIASGEYIRAEGDDQPMGFIVASGRFAMMKTSLNGKELVVELLPPGDIFGLLAALHKIPAQLSARAQVKSTVLWMPGSNLTLILKDYPKLYEEFTAHLLRSLFSSYSLARGLAHDRVEVRIAAILTNLAFKFARAQSLDKEHVIDITRQQIADLTGTTPETAIRVTRAMQSKGMLEMKQPGIIKVLNLEALQALAEE